jgi:hypothetical protein
MMVRSHKTNESDVIDFMDAAPKSATLSPSLSVSLANSVFPISFLNWKLSYFSPCV